MSRGLGDVYKRQTQRGIDSVNYNGAINTAAAANDLMNFSITAPVRVYRGQLSSKLQIYVNSQQVNTVNVAIEVVKE